MTFLHSKFFVKYNRIPCTIYNFLLCFPTIIIALIGELFLIEQQTRLLFLITTLLDKDLLMFFDAFFCTSLVL